MKRSKSLVLAKRFLGKEIEIIIDRPLGSKHPKHKLVYEVNYGYIPNTLAPDNEGLDAYFLGVDKPLGKVKGKCIGVTHRLDDDDAKLIVVSKGVKFTDQEIEDLIRFQEKFFAHRLIKNKD